MLPLTSTTNSCSISSPSSVSRRHTRPSWVSTIRPLASVSSGTSGVRLWKWRWSSRTPEGSSGQRVAAWTSSAAGLGPWIVSKPAGLCSRKVAGSTASSRAAASSVTTSLDTGCAGSSTTRPSTETQPPLMYCSASLREHWTRSARCLDSRIGLVISRRQVCLWQPVYPSGKPGSECTFLGRLSLARPADLRGTCAPAELSFYRCAEPRRAERMLTLQMGSDRIEFGVVDLFHDEFSIGGAPFRFGICQRQPRRMRADERIDFSQRIAMKTGPWVGVRSRDHAGTDGVEFDVAKTLPEIGIAFDRTCLVADFP